ALRLWRRHADANRPCGFVVPPAGRDFYYASARRSFQWPGGAAFDNGAGQTCARVDGGRPAGYWRISGIAAAVENSLAELSSYVARVGQERFCRERAA